MTFRAIRLEHKEQAPWDRVTHVRLKPDAVADTVQGQQVLNHIRGHADGHGVASIARIEPGFPARKAGMGRRGMEIDLRHMANARDAGKHTENNGLLELGWIE